MNNSSDVTTYQISRIVSGSKITRIKETARLASGRPRRPAPRDFPKLRQCSPTRRDGGGDKGGRGGPSLPRIETTRRTRSSQSTPERAREKVFIKSRADRKREIAIRRRAGRWVISLAPKRFITGTAQLVRSLSCRVVTRPKMVCGRREGRNGASSHSLARYSSIEQ